MRTRPSPKQIALLIAALLTAPVMAPGAAASEGGGAEGGGAEGEPVRPSPLFVMLDPLDVPIVEGDRADGRLKITLVLEAADAAGASALETRLPECREAALAASIEFARLRASPSSPVDAQRLVNDLSIALRPVDRAIAAVLLVEVSARRA